MQKPFKHQAKTTQFILNKKQCLITSDPGTGKTRSVIDAYVKLPEDRGRMLVIAPLSILQASWGDDIEKFQPELTYEIAYAKNRAKAFASSANVIYAHYESFHSEQQCVDFLSRDKRLKLAFKPYHTVAQIDAICDRLEVDDFLLMAYNPGIKVQNAFFDLDQLNDTERFVTVDGGVTPETLSQFQLHPRIRLVAGSKIIFNNKYEENMRWLTS